MTDPRRLADDRYVFFTTRDGRIGQTNLTRPSAADTPVVIAVRKGAETNDVVAQIQNLADGARSGQPTGDEDDVWYECASGHDSAIAAPLLDRFAAEFADIYLA